MRDTQGIKESALATKELLVNHRYYAVTYWVLLLIFISSGSILVLIFYIAVSGDGHVPTAGVPEIFRHLFLKYFYTTSEWNNQYGSSIFVLWCLVPSILTILTIVINMLIFRKRKNRLNKSSGHFAKLQLYSVGKQIVGRLEEKTYYLLTNVSPRVNPSGLPKHSMSLSSSVVFRGKNPILTINEEYPMDVPVTFDHLDAWRVAGEGILENEPTKKEVVISWFLILAPVTIYYILITLISLFA